MDTTAIWRKIAAHLRVRSASWLRGSYARALEAEIARLRAENRALINSILGLAGIPPMRIAAILSSAGAAPSHPAGAGLASPGRLKGHPCENARMTNAETNSHTAALRRRSWQQLGRLREICDARAARRERESDALTFPPPRNIIPRV